MAVDIAIAHMTIAQVAAPSAFIHQICDPTSFEPYMTHLSSNQLECQAGSQYRDTAMSLSTSMSLLISMPHQPLCHDQPNVTIS